ncbi:hypothetical protein QBC33DRAFT_556801 [Phialemonium atrogriseum]|uniref:Enoyl reductase (ER) domain-containing protein n=1 Tax=Phialemonium atrogriseum TaxID=1093897 RepID=A0AAJ0FID6_9PEZI|nr:uncharacterized protein QBC33DRAFT_556801 [Phialemonium atrogriseum]KAK1769511.1 hypothetical protein QBC33DRAFT_556801 [Phialemonium atrogriseum]
MDGEFMSEYGAADPFALWLYFQQGGKEVQGDENNSTKKTPRPDQLRLQLAPAPATRCMKAVWAAHASPDDPLAALRCDIVPVPALPVPMPMGGSSAGRWVRVRVTRTSLNRRDVAALRGHAGVGAFPVGLGCEAVGRLEDGAEVLVYPVISDAAAVAAAAVAAAAAAARETVTSTATASAATSFCDDDDDDDGEGGGGGGGHNGVTTGTRRLHVLGRHMHGLMAEYAVVPAANLVPKPLCMPVNTAAVLGCAWLVAYRMLFTLSGLPGTFGGRVVRRREREEQGQAQAQAQAQGGRRMLVQGSSGGVATALVQMGAAAGMQVWATGRTEEKRALALRLGAERAFAPDEEIPLRAHAVFSLCGAATWAQAVDSVEDGGAIVLCGDHGGGRAEMDLAGLISRGVAVRGAGMATMEEFRELVGFVAEHRIRPLIDSVVPLDSGVRQGLERFMAGKVRGKLVVSL